MFSRPSFEPPVRYFALPDKFAAARGSGATVLKLLQKVCRAKSAGDAQTFDRLRRLLEDKFLKDQRLVDYRLVILTYNPIDRWKDGSVLSTDLLGTYRTGTPGE